MIILDEDKNLVNYILDFIRRYYVFFLISILALSCFNLFYCLGETPIYSWDEARHGVNAYEMLRQQEYIVNTYGYKPDYWNLKPPLSFWAIMLGYKIAGFNPFGLRLFSALGAFATILICTLFVSFKHGKVASLVTAAVLTTSPKYIVIHSARTADADSLFVLFFTASIISMFLSERSNNWLYASGFFFSLAFMTKSWHALNIAMIVFLYLLLTGRLFRLKPGEWLRLLASSTVLILLWGFMRYSKDGLTFFKTMFYYDLMTRSSNSLEGHIGDKLYYFNVLSSFYKLWLLLLVLCICLFFAAYGKSTIERESTWNWKYILGMLLWMALPFTLFTMVKTKIGWYILPIYPALAVCIGGLCGALLEGTKKSLIIQLALVLLIVKGTFDYEKVIIRHILLFRDDEKRVSFNYFKADSSIRGSKAYISYIVPNLNYGPKSEIKDWKQSDLLSAELYWDLIPVDGGLVGFLREKNEKAVMLMPNDEIAIRIAGIYNLKTIGKSSSLLILGK